MTIRIEDCFEDVISKTQAGLGLSNDALAKSSGVSEEALSSLKAGKFDERTARDVAAVLKLDAGSLIDLANDSWFPQAEAPEGVLCFNTPFPIPGYEEMTVNSYIVFDPESKSAVAFDTGADAAEMIQAVKEHGLKLEAILITHAHSDHIKDLLSLKSETEAPAFIFEKESVAGAKPFAADKVFSCGNLIIRPVETSGHSKGGTTFVIEGLSRFVAIVGDALFAGSVGGAASAWEDALAMIREKILTLPDNAVICPGHGPLTTVAEEKAHNPIFPELKEKQAPVLDAVGSDA
ncbi:MBL fold metallo-hydrolase [Rubellicoccus peritrichatus]|uniref:MBL fold metallo-hydrolase n=1 Tax=Rubellicoccus peritrichatus TaxID=3080537 RepID=A0AAQ3LGR5_9BACT|nr:MBL fold metallo-hydrolase [Puniceicoccus sp. CR14]WOO41854.1 MBL fold metallo-hydrolase [Puniceicoccus sp. CR14]